MQGPTHDKIGIAAAAGTALALHAPAPMVLYLTGAAVMTAARHRWRWRAWAIAGAASAARYGVDLAGMAAAFIAFAYLAARAPDRLEFGILPHRGPLTHGPFVVGPQLAAVTYAAAAYGPGALAAAAGFAVGYMSHLAADSCTVHGTPGDPVTDRLWLLPARARMVTGHPFTRPAGNR